MYLSFVYYEMQNTEIIFHNCQANLFELCSGLMVYQGDQYNFIYFFRACQK